MEAELKFYTKAYAPVSSFKCQLFPPRCWSRIFVSPCMSVIHIHPLLDHESI